MKEVHGLQHEQLNHDRRQHADILYLPLDRRIAHYVLHLSKYAGRAIEQMEGAENLEKTLVDTCIIALAIANALRIDLSTEFTNGFGEREFKGGTSQQFGVHLAVVVGRMSKACEALDHLELFDSRGELERGARLVANACSAAARAWKIDLEERVRVRWRGIEKNGYPQ